MRTISRSTRFKKDFKREARSGYGQTFLETLAATIKRLADDTPLPDKLYDHALTGNWNGYRDCHIRPDIVLIYRKPSADLLELVRIGSHSELDLESLSKIVHTINSLQCPPTSSPA